MKKAFLTTLFVVAATVANASYLYWQVSSSDNTLPDTQGTDWNVARVVYSTANATQVDTWNDSDKRSGAIGTGYNIISDNSEYMRGTSVGSEVGAPMPTVLYADLGSNASSYSYYVELLSSTGALYARSDAVTYSELVTAGAVKTELSLGTLASVTPWHASDYTVVPEPTSAVLMLFGAAFLGLKRKNRSIA